MLSPSALANWCLQKLGRCPSTQVGKQVLAGAVNSSGSLGFSQQGFLSWGHPRVVVLSRQKLCWGFVQVFIGQGEVQWRRGAWLEFGQGEDLCQGIESR